MPLRIDGFYKIIFARLMLAECLVQLPFFWWAAISVLLMAAAYRVS